ncbi:MAG: hypothetical protein DRP09_12120 [Candidatus Thorarchaeota archaeon]|nr:MAG: hypothetical protein DRP09_12120 [Candidatus Thorarchaeota archaeon]
MSRTASGLKNVVAAEADSILPNNPVIIIGGADVITQYNKMLQRKISLYNERLEKLSSPYFLRTTHTSNGYQYPGRYFYKWVWNQEKERMERRYVGLVIPEDDEVPEGGLPKAPINILEGFEYKIFYHDIVCSQEMYEQFFHFFEPHGLVVLKIENRGEKTHG